MFFLCVCFFFFFLGGGGGRLSPSMFLDRNISRRNAGRLLGPAM